MIPFFRKIRKKLADDNQFFKYSRYAIGEIVLVVIGILIALQVNNWNENKKTESQIDSLFYIVFNELDSNIEQTNKIIQFYRQKDSLHWLVNYNQVDANDYKMEKIPGLIDLTETYKKIYLRKNAYNNLLVYHENIQEKYKSVLKGLDTLNNALFSEVERYNMMIEEFVELSRYNDALEHSWYANSSIGIDNLEKEKQIDFLLNDFRYKNRSERYRQISITLIQRVISYRQQAISIYLQIAYLLNLSSEKYGFFVPEDLRKSLIGKYKIQGLNSIYVINEDEKALYYRDLEYPETFYEIHYCDKNDFITENGIYFSLSIHEKDIVLNLDRGLTLVKQQENVEVN